MSLITSSNDRVIHAVMKGRNATRDRNILQNQVYLKKMVVTLGADYKPTFSIDRFYFQDQLPTPNNYKNAMNSFNYYSEEFFGNLIARIDTWLDLGKFSSPREALQNELEETVLKYGEDHFFSLYTFALLNSNWPEKHITTPLNNNTDEEGNI